MPAQGFQMRLRGVALVHREAVLRVLLVGLQAPGIAPDLGDDGSRRDGRDQQVTLDDGLGRDRQLRQAIAIDEHLRRRQPQAAHRLAHRLQGGLQDVQFINLLR
jgi:hypothetical protein